jgi:hypothetical protein
MSRRNWKSNVLSEGESQNTSALSEDTQEGAQELTEQHMDNMEYSILQAMKDALDDSLAAELEKVDTWRYRGDMIYAIKDFIELNPEKVAVFLRPVHKELKAKIAKKEKMRTAQREKRMKLRSR